MHFDAKSNFNYVTTGEKEDGRGEKEKEKGRRVQKERKEGKANVTSSWTWGRHLLESGSVALFDSIFVLTQTPSFSNLIAS